jgi:ankyrin repeat protein
MVQAGDAVEYEGGTFTVQYVNSKGKLDLKNTNGGNVEYGISPDAVMQAGAETEGIDLAFCAAYRGDVAGVRAAVDGGLQVNTQDRDGHTMLMAASGGGNALSTIALLLDRGAKIDLQDKKCNAALMLACSTLNTSAVELLLDQRASVDLQSKEGDTALMQAASSGRSAIVGLLLARGASVELQDREGHTALMCGAFNGHSEIVRRLLKAGARLSAKANDGQSALQMAAEQGHAAWCVAWSRTCRPPLNSLAHPSASLVSAA